MLQRVMQSFGFHREEQLKAVFSYIESHSSLSEVKVNPAFLFGKLQNE